MVSKQRKDRVFQTVGDCGFIDSGGPGLWTCVLLMTLALMLSATSATANVSLEPIAVMTIDDDGRLLNYPHSVFYDPVQDEIYLANGGTSRIVVYGSDFFPGMSIGVSRGVEAPRGGTVLDNGDVYVLQVRNASSERPRITVLNGAFFVEREIFLDEIPEAADYSPRQLAISRDGLIYLTGSSNRGALVLDAEGNFLRRLRPRDRTARVVVDDEDEVIEGAAQQNESLVTIVEEVAPPSMGDIPEEFRPRSGRLDPSAQDQDGLSPVIVNDVTIDSRGRLYLLSTETSKVYVYGPDEVFLFSFGSKGGTPRHLSQPRAVAIDEERELIYVSDYMRHSILAYSMTGEYKFEFGGRGAAPGWFNFPEDMTINKKGQLIVADLFNRRVQVLEVKYEESPPEPAVSRDRGARGTPGLRSSPASADEVTDEVRGSEEVEPVTDEVGGEEGTAPLSEEAAGALREAQIEETIIVDP
jgi:DNA-binding beta-propeller fold protein YncE